MEGLKMAPVEEVREGENEILERKEKLESAALVVKNLFEEINKRSAEEVSRNPFYKNFSERT